MDNKKDISVSIQGKSLGVFLGNNPALFFVLKKVEKLVGALYIIAGFMPASEPLSEKLKGHCLELMSYTARSVVSGGRWSFEVGQKLKEIIVEIMSIIEIAFMAGFVSAMNKDVVLDEFNKLILIIDREGNKAGITVSKDAFDVGLQNPISITNNLIRRNDMPQSVKGQYKKDTAKIGHKLGAVTADKRHSRRDEIVEVFRKEKKFLSVKDVNIYFKDYSDKTIQRELLALVADGILKKEGERRWSKYILA